MMKKNLLILPLTVAVLFSSGCSKEEAPYVTLTAEEGVTRLISILAHEGISLQKEAGDIYAIYFANDVATSMPSKGRSTIIQNKTVKQSEYSGEDLVLNLHLESNASEHHIYDTDQMIDFTKSTTRRNDIINSTTRLEYEDIWYEHYATENRIRGYEHFLDVSEESEEEYYTLSCEKDWHLYPSHIKITGLLGLLVTSITDILNGEYFNTERNTSITKLSGESKENFTFSSNNECNLIMKYTVNCNDFTFQMKNYTEAFYKYNGSFSMEFQFKNYRVETFIEDNNYNFVSGVYQTMVPEKYQEIKDTFLGGFANDTEGYTPRDKSKWKAD